MKKILCLLTAVMMLMSMAACSGPEADPTKAPGTDGFTLSNSILGEDHEFTYDAVPRRIVSLASPATEMLLALGLEENIAGYAMQENEIPEKYKAAFTAGDALVADIFRTAGGENVINNTTDPWLNVSWEEIAAADPEWIVIGVYEGAEDADYWMDFLKNHPACGQMKAVQNENFVITGLVDLTVGERIADTVPMLAAKFHPES